MANKPSRIELEIVISEILNEKETDIYRIDTGDFVDRVRDKYGYDRDGVKESVIHEVERLAGPNAIQISGSSRGKVEIMDLNRTRTEDKLFPDE